MSNKSATTNSSICRKRISHWFLTKGLLLSLTALFFGPITDYYHTLLSFLFHPWFQTLLDWNHSFWGLLLFGLAFLFIVAIWICTILKPKHPTPIGQLIGKVAVLVSLHYLMIRILPVFDQHVFVLPWSFLPLGSSWFKYSDIALLPIMHGLLQPVYYFIRSNLPSVFKRLKRELCERLVLLRRLVKYPFFQSFRSKGIIEPPANQPDFPWQEDCPIENYKDDAFNRKVLVKELVDRIVKWRPEQSSFNISITGEWGSGKTSFLNMVKNQLQKRAVVVDYVPWSYHHPTDLTAQFFEQLANAFGDEPTYRDLAATIRSAAVGTGFWGNLTAQILDYPRSYTALKERIETSLKYTNGKRLVIIVDELDRLTADELTEVLKLLKNLGSIKGSYIITSFDKEAILANLSQIEDGNKYLEKFFQAEVPLGKIPLSNTIADKLIKWMEEIGIENSRISSIRSAMNTHDGINFDSLNAYAIWTTIITPRRLNLYINTVNTRWNFFSKTLDKYSFLLLELIRLHYPTVYLWLESKEIVEPAEDRTKYTFNKSKYDELAKKVKFHSEMTERERLVLGTTLEGLFERQKLPLQIMPYNRYYYDLYFTHQYFKNVDLVKLTQCRLDGKHEEIATMLSRVNSDERKVLVGFMRRYEIVTTEDLLFEIKLALTHDEIYPGHSVSIITELYEMDRRNPDANHYELKEPVYKLCRTLIQENMSYQLFNSWTQSIHEDKSKNLFSIDEIQGLCKVRFIKAVDKELSMHALHKYLLASKDLGSFPDSEFFDPDIIDSFHKVITRNEDYGYQFLKYCITPIDRGSDFYLPEHSLIFQWQFSVRFFNNVNDFISFINEFVNNQNEDIKYTAKRVQKFGEHGGYNAFGKRDFDKTLVIELRNAKEHGIDIKDMDPAVFIGFNLK